MKNWEVISKFIVVNYNHIETKITMAVKNTVNPIITVPKIPEDTTSRVDIFIWENKYKQSNMNEINFEDLTIKHTVLYFNAELQNCKGS